MDYLRLLVNAALILRVPKAMYFRLLKEMYLKLTRVKTMPGNIRRKTIDMMK